MVQKLLVSWLLALFLVGCGEGVVLTAKAPAPPLPQDEATWLNGRADFAALHGHVVLVEAWHPS